MSTAFTPFRVRQRVSIATAVLAAAFLLILGAFFRAQIIGNADYRRQSENNRIRRMTLAAPRGMIYDRNGKPIAESAKAACATAS